MRLKNLALVKLAELDFFAWNNPTGVFCTPNGQTVKVGINGASDILAVKDGKIYGFEIKTGSGVQSQAQKTWQKVFESHGGIYKVVRSIDDLR